MHGADRVWAMSSVCLSENMGVVFVQLGRAVKHGCSDCVIICRLINILFEQGESFPDSH